MDGATATFTGLTNGVGYTLSAVTFNDCGSSGPITSPVFTPGVAPDWTRHSPPLTAQPGAYVYKFAASGDPSPTFSLVGAPSWLTISPNGLVSGRLPAGVESFSYSVVASNGVGIDAGPLYPTTDIVAGPFVVTVPGAVRCFCVEPIYRPAADAAEFPPELARLPCGAMTADRNGRSQRLCVAPRNTR